MSCCPEFLQCLPVVILISLMLWLYYAYVVELCVNTIQDIDVARESTYLVIFHILYIMLTWTYFRVICTEIALVPPEFRVPPNLYHQLKQAATESEQNILLLEFCRARQLPLITRNESGYIRFCINCKQVKPDRAHHCQQCGTCVLKMDHHCPWVNNCIGLSNYKFFVQFVFYAGSCCLFSAATSGPYFYSYWTEPSDSPSRQIQIVIVFIIAVALSILTVSFFCFHMSLIIRNETTLETLASPVFRDFATDLSFDMGACENFIQVMGPDCLLWFIPVEGDMLDGIHYALTMTL